MITGFNTDVKHKTKVYHVQTEDKGRENPRIETLVYLGGQILDSIKASYQTDPPLSESTISEMMESQHKKIIRNIKIGKFDDPSEDNWELGTLSLDEAVLEYLAEYHAEDKIEVQISGLDQLVIGTLSILKFQVRNAATHTPVERARVRIKILSPSFPPQILGTGETNKEGQFESSITVPSEIVGKNCMLKIQVFSDSGNAEKQLLLPE